MRLVTIQHEDVFKQLWLNGIYTVSADVPIASNLIKPYKFMMDYYGYEHRPIFMCPVGYCVNFAGANVDNAVVIELEVPLNYCKIQDYYGWSDFVYFSELPWEYKETYGCITVEQFGEYILSANSDGFNCGNDTVYQVTTLLLLRDWILRVRPITEEFLDKYYNNGGIYKLVI